MTIATNNVVSDLVTEQTLDTQVAEMRVEIARLSEIIDRQVELLDDIKDAIGPVMDKLASNPMFRMMFGSDDK